MTRKRRREIPEQIPGFGTLITFERVFAQKARHADLVNYTRRFPKVRFIGMICGIGAILYNDPDPSPFGLQLRFAREFAPLVPTMRLVIEVLEREPCAVLVYEEQLAVLVKYGLLEANASEWPKDGAADLLMRILLVYNSLHGAEREPQPGDYQAFMEFELQSVFNLSEHFGRVIGRYAAFFDWARNDERAHHSKNRLDLDGDFKRFYGMTYEEWAAAAFAIAIHFRQITSVKAMETNKPILRVTEYLEGVSSDAAIWKWLKFNTIPMDEAIALFERTKGDPSYAGVTLLPFMRRPLLGIDDQNVCVPYLPYLENSLGAGLFFAFLDGYNEQADKTSDQRKADSDQFTRFFGEFFEDYIVDLFRNAHPTPHLVFGEQKYMTEGGTEGNSTDLVVFEGDAALFIDISASRFNVAKTLVRLDAKAIQKDMEKIVIENAEQLDRSIRAFRQGRLRYPGVESEKIRRIFPIVLTIQPIPRAFEFNRRALHEISKRSLLTGVERLEILTSEDAEGLGALFRGSVLLSDIIARKLAHSHPKAQNDSLKNYLFFFEKETLAKAVQSRSKPQESPWIRNVTAVVGQWLGVSEEERDL